VRRRGRPPHPELLTPREQEVLSLLREGKTNREIAERLSITHAGAAYHVKEILSKLNVKSRYEAATWPLEAVRVRRRVPFPSMLAAAGRLASGSIGRAIAVGALVVAAVALGLLAVGVIEMERRGGEPKAAAQATATPEGEPSATATPEPMVSPFQNAAPYRFTSKTLDADEPVNEEHGIALIDLSTGQAEHWAVNTDAAGFMRYSTSPNHRWLAASGADRVGDVSVIADRQTGNQYSYDGRAWALAAGPTDDGLALMRKSDSGGEHRLVDLGGDPAGTGRVLVSSQVDGRASMSAFLFSNGSLALVDGQLFDLTTGQPFAQMWQPDGVIQVALSPLANGGVAAVVFMGDRNEPAMLVVRLDATGAVVARTSFPSGGSRASGYGSSPKADAVRVSPDGRWIAWQSTLQGSIPFYSFWPAVVVADLSTGQEVFRVVRSSIREWAAQDAWLADSSGLILETPEGSALLRVTGGGGLTSMPFESAPAPTHHDPGLLVHRGRLVRLDGTPAGPASASGGWTMSDPLDGANISSSGGEARLIKVMPPGRDGLLYVLRKGDLPSLLQLQPFSDTLRVRVNTGGDGLNLRRSPSTDGATLATLPDNTVATVTDAPDEIFGVETSSVPDDIEQHDSRNVPWWIHVQTDTGLSGWVRAEYLAWAP
jgi:DNA-binding CsgD family transcriptional regulator